VLDYLYLTGLQVDIKKSEFKVIYIKYLGFIISITGIKVDPKKIEVIYNWQPLKTVKGV
jgi:hypothetical protein